MMLMCPLRQLLKRIDTVDLDDVVVAHDCLPYLTTIKYDRCTGGAIGSVKTKPVQPLYDVASGRVLNHFLLSSQLHIQRLNTSSWIRYFPTGNPFSKRRRIVLEVVTPAWGNERCWSKRYGFGQGPFLESIQLLDPEEETSE